MRSIAQRIAFRFWFIYLGLFCIFSQPLMGLVPLVDTYPLCTYPPVSWIISWTAVHVFRIHAPLVFVGSGSGDKVTDWVFHFLLLVIAIVATAIWSALDRKRSSYGELAKWFTVFVRFALAGQLVGYGLAKLVPLQMPFPRLATLLEPYGNFSPMGVLWGSIGASQAYESFAGAAELLGGVLLIFPRTTMLGALVCVADMTQVFTLNMTYDVPVKILSFHLLLLSLYLLAPSARRFADFFLLDRSVAPAAPPPLLRTPRGNRIASIAQIAIGLYLIGTNVYGSITGWSQYGGGSPKSALYGIWNVESLSIDGRERPPLLTDRDRFERVVFDVPERVSFERMDDTFASYGAKIAVPKKILTLSDAKNEKWKARYTFERIGRSRMVLDGLVDKHRVRMRLALVDRNQFMLVSRGFNWVQDYPFNH